MNYTVKTMTKIAFFTALIAVLAQISIPFYPVPFTAQVFGVFLAGILMGSRAGLLSILTYLLMGAAGMPVFAMWRGGLQVILGPSGGYLLGFIPGIYCLGKLTGDRNRSNNAMLIAGMLVFLVIIYTCGGLQLSYIMKLDFKQTMVAGVIPFLPLDLIKVGLTIPLVAKLRRISDLNVSEVGNRKSEMSRNKPYYKKTGKKL